MKKKLIYLFIIPMLIFGGLFGVKSVIAIDQSQKYYQIDLKMKDGELINTNIMLRSGGDYEVGDKLKKEIRGELYNFSGEKLSLTSLNYPKEEEVVSVKLPYSVIGKEVRIFDNNTNDELLNISVSIFAETCGDGICQEQENFVKCSDDCPSGGSDRKCDKELDGLCDPDCRPEKLDPDWPNCSVVSITEKTENKDSREAQKNNDKKGGMIAATDVETEKGRTTGGNIKRIIIWIGIIAVVIVVFAVVMRIKERDDEM